MPNLADKFIDKGNKEDEGDQTGSPFLDGDNFFRQEVGYKA